MVMNDVNLDMFGILAPVWTQAIRSCFLPRKTGPFFFDFDCEIKLYLCIFRFLKIHFCACKFLGIGIGIFAGNGCLSWEPLPMKESPIVSPSVSVFSTFFLNYVICDFFMKSIPIRIFSDPNIGNRMRQFDCRIHRQEIVDCRDLWRFFNRDCMILLTTAVLVSSFAIVMR